MYYKNNIILIFYHLNLIRGYCNSIIFLSTQLLYWQKITMNKLEEMVHLYYKIKGGMFVGSIKKNGVFFFIVFLLVITLGGLSEITVEAGEMSKEIKPNVSSGHPLKKNLSQNFSLSPSSFPLKGNGDYIDTLFDSWESYHYLTFENVTNYSSSTMNINILYESDYYYIKDPIVTIEFYKEKNGTLTYQDFLEFDTEGYLNARLISNVYKSTFSDQKYIYMSIGVSEIYDIYYSDYTDFKVLNPFYVQPDTTPPSKPTVNTVGDNATAVTGKAEINSSVYVKKGTTLLGQATTTSTGTFSVPIPKQVVGTKLTVYAQDQAGNKSGEVYVTIVDKTPPAKPGITTIGDNQTIIVGTAEAGSTVTLKLGTTVLSQKISNNYGYFTMTIAKQKAGSILSFYATDKAGNKSTTTSVKVVDVTPPKTPTVNKVTYTSTSISGVTEAGATVYAYNGTTYLGKATASSTGSYKITIPAQKQGSTIKVYARDSSGNQSGTTSVVVY